MTYSEQLGNTGMSPEATTAELLQQLAMPELPMPEGRRWPMLTHEPAVGADAAEALPLLVERLSQPAQGVTVGQVREIIGRHYLDPDRWIHLDHTDGSFRVSRRFTQRGDTRYSFDQNGRLIQREHLLYPGSSHTGQREFIDVERFEYSDEGYIVARHVQNMERGTFTDLFEYSSGAYGRVPTLMTRIPGDEVVGSQILNPMTVNLDDWRGWLAANRNGGYKLLHAVDTLPEELIIDSYEVTEERAGLRFGGVTELEDALVTYGLANFGGRSTYSEMQNMLAFVRRFFTGTLEAKWQEVQRSGNPGADHRVYKHFASEGMGCFVDQDVKIEITKSGIELFVERGELALASYLGKKPGLRGINIDIPVNRATQEGSFYVDLLAACQDLDLNVTPDQITDYVNRGFGHDTPGSLWQDQEARRHGVDVDVDLTVDNEDSRMANLLPLMSTDRRAVWGPLPKMTYDRDIPQEPVLRIRIAPMSEKPYVRKRGLLPNVVIVPAQGAYNATTAARTQQVAQNYIDRINAAIAAGSTGSADTR